MRIRDLRLERDPASSRATATVEWEDSARPPQQLAFSISGELESAPEPAPEAFFLAAALAAARNREERLWIDATLCPVFLEGLKASLTLLDSWYGGSRSAMLLETGRGLRARPRRAPAAALFLSGGVDSLFQLRRNRLDYPRTHPSSFGALIHVRAFGHFGEAGAEASQNIAERASGVVTRIAREEDARLILVESDARFLEPDHRFFVLESHGSLLAAAAHLFPGVFTTVSIAASADLRRPYRPWGSHPLLDPLFGSAAVSIRHSGHEYSRLEKVNELSRWDLAMSSLLVCNQAPLSAGVINCGRCEKCLRTLCELLAAGALDRAETFAVREVTPEAIRALPTIDEYAIRRWEDLRLEFSNAGELARAIDDWIARLHAAADWQSDRGWKGALRRFDRAWLGGRLLAFRRRRSAAA